MVGAESLCAGGGRGDKRSGFFIGLLLLLLLSACLAAAGSAAAEHELWVAAPGLALAEHIPRQNIYPNLLAARDAAVPLLAAQSGDVVIHLRGLLRLDEPLVLDARHSARSPHRLIFRGHSSTGEKGAKGAKGATEAKGSKGATAETEAADASAAVISGGIAIRDWSAFREVPAGVIYRAAVGPVRSRQLYVDGVRAQRARSAQYPLGFYPSYRPSDIGANGILYDYANPAALAPEQWTQPEAVEAVANTMWRMMRVPVASVATAADGRHGLIRLEGQAWDNANLNTSQLLGVFFPNIFSFWQLSYFENALEFLDQPGEWFLDERAHELYYMPRPGEYLRDPPAGQRQARVELPVLETLVEGRGSPQAPLTNIHFENIRFQYATWNGPSERDGYIADQSGFYIRGRHAPNTIDHVKRVERSHANLAFEYARGLVWRDNVFEHLGGVALSLGTGSQHNRIEHNRFHDIASSAIMLGGVEPEDYRPDSRAKLTLNNRISDNAIRATGRDYVDSAAIFAGFTRGTRIEHNQIRDVPWSAIALGWGWGLLDPDRFPGILNLKWSDYVWGQPFSYHRDGDGRDIVPVGNSVVAHNHIDNFLNVLNDGGAIYTSGRQADSMDGALTIRANLARNKPARNGGNTFYLDGGSRYIRLSKNVSENNPIGSLYLGPQGRGNNYYNLWIQLLDHYRYGRDVGGCNPYGDIVFDGSNRWPQGVPTTAFYDICPYTSQRVAPGTRFPVNMRCDIEGQQRPCPVGGLQSAQGV